MSMDVRFSANLHPQRQAPLFGASGPQGPQGPEDDEDAAQQPPEGAFPFDLPEGADGEQVIMLGPEQLQALFMNGGGGIDLAALLGGGKPQPLLPDSDPDAPLANRVVENGAPDVAQVLVDAKELAAEKGHAEVNSLHVLAVILKQMVDLSDNYESPAVERNINKFLQQDKNIWAGMLGPLVQAASLGETALNLQDAYAEVSQALGQLPQTGSAPKDGESVPLSKSLKAIFEDKLSTAERQRPSEELRGELVQEAAGEHAEHCPGCSQTRQVLQAKGAEVMGKYRELAEPLQQEMAEVSEAFETALSEAMAQAPDEVREVYSAFEEKAEALEERHGELQMALMTGQASMQDVMAEMEQSSEEAGALLEQAIDLLKAQAPEVYEEKLKELNERREAFNNIEESNPEFAKAQADVEAFEQQMEEFQQHLLQEGERAVANEYDDAAYSSIVTAAFANSLDPELEKDPSVKQAQRIFKHLRERLGGGMYVDTETVASYLQNARRHGAGRKELDILNGYLTQLKMEIGSFSMQQEMAAQGKAPMSSNGLKTIGLISRFAEAFGEVDWKNVGGRKVDMDRAKQILDSNEDIPKSIKRNIVNFLKTGNKNGWTGQPLLLVSGDGATEFLRDKVVEVLQEILKIPVFEPQADRDPGIAMANGMVMKDDELSLPAEALIETKDPHSMIYIKNLLSFLNGSYGAMKQLDQLTSADTRKNYREWDIEGAAMDASPFVVVVGTNSGITEQLEEIYSDRFNDKDVSVIDLNVDIDVFARERAARNHFVGPIEQKYNVRFADDVVKFLVRNYAVFSRHDYIKKYLEQAASAASGDNYGDEPVKITIEDLQKKYLGPAISKHFVDYLTEPSVGKVNILAAGSIFGAMERLGLEVANRRPYDAAKDKEGQYHVGRVLGPTGEMYEHSAIKAVESFLTSMTNGSFKAADGREYERMKTQKDAFTILFDSEMGDGPSAGAANALAAVSLVTGIPVRDDVALTGTIQTGGHVGMIGGQFQKLQAAYQSGHIKTLMLPRTNYDQLVFEHPKFVSNLQSEGVEVVPVDTIDDVLKYGLVDYDKLFEPMPESEQKSPEEKPVPVYMVDKPAEGTPKFGSSQPQQLPGKRLQLVG